jgi:hypothetical protein
LAMPMQRTTPQRIAGLLDYRMLAPRSLRRSSTTTADRAGMGLSV